MEKRSLKLSCFGFVIVLLLLQACASTQLSRKDLDVVGTIRVVRYKTPDLTVKTLKGVVFELVGGGAIVPTLVATHADEKATKTATQGVIFPDYGEHLVKQFVKISQQEIRGWPKTTPVSNPVEKGHEYKDGAFIVFDINHMWITLYGGLTIEGDVVMKNAGGDRIFARHFFYRSRDFGIKKDQDAYTADNCRLLRDEIPVAAELTARDLIIKFMKESL